MNGYSDLVRDRADADGEMREISTGVCNDAPWAAWFDVWDKWRFGSETPWPGAATREENRIVWGSG